jgi:hypothetical protein
VSGIDVHPVRVWDRLAVFSRRMKGMQMDAGDAVGDPAHRGGDAIAKTISKKRNSHTGGRGDAGDFDWAGAFGGRYVEICSSTARDWRIPPKRMSTAGRSAPGRMIQRIQPRWSGPKA